jgi:hypothetical protein
MDVIFLEKGVIKARGMSSDLDEGVTQTLATDVGDVLFLRAEALPTARADEGEAADVIVTWLVASGSDTEIRALAARREE